MAFFEAQDNARRTTRWLIVVYFFAYAILCSAACIALLIYLSAFAYVAILLGVAESATTIAADLRIVIAIFTVILIMLIMLVAVLFRSFGISSGGGKVATMLGGTRLEAFGNEDHARRLRNVVEEMAIASGVPVPDVYVLEQEEGINAFAAGFTPADAAITVTRGAVELLSRDELQGVIGHEFSHLLNGDMRLYTRMMGPQHGLGLIAAIGLALMRGQMEFSLGMLMSIPQGILHVIMDAMKENPLAGLATLVLAPVWVPIMVGAIFAILLVLTIASSGVAIVGFCGQQLARAIKGAVSRQREYLADASAVQFTRQAAGIAGALKKIGGYSKASYLAAVDPEEVSHMLFGRGAKRFVGSATHPPLAKRIRALDPSFNESDYPRVEPIPAPQVMDEEEPAEQLPAAIAFTGASETAVVSPVEQLPAANAFTGASETAVVSPVEIAESVGQPDAAQVEYSQELRRSIPDNLYDAAHSLEMAYPLTVALILDRSGRHTERQMTLVEDRLSAERSQLVRGYQKDIANIGAEYRLPLLVVAFPALKRRPASQLVELDKLAKRLVRIDGKIDLYEHSFGQILRLNLRHVLNPSGARRIYSRSDSRAALANVLMAVAQSGHENPVDGQAALDAGKPLLGKWAIRAKMDVNQEVTPDTLEQSLDILSGIKGRDFSNVLLAVCQTVVHDGRLNAAERDLIRVVCATLDCPLPPILIDLN
jgi:Zn-dependent protease with chaperone function